MKDEFYKDKIQLLLQKHGRITSALLQIKLKVSKEEADRLYKLFGYKPEPINNFASHINQKTLIRKHPCNSVSIPYLQKRLCLEWKETEELLNEWRNIKKESDVYRQKFSEISKYLKPPKFKKKPESLSELQRKKENRTINAIRFLESIGYTVEKR